MLKEKNAFEGKVLAIKLVTGEEIIARCVEFDNQDITLKRPLTLVMTVMPDSKTQGQVSFAPWMLGLTEDQLVKINGSRVVYAAPARQDAAEQYKEATGDKDVVESRGVASSTASR